MQRAAALGCYFSVNAEMTRSDRGRILVTEMPLDRILTETDGPFTQMQGRPAEPADVRLTVASIADVRTMATSTVSDTVRKNLQALLKT
nr:TatD family hydrolase [Bradyrhizobium altum]